MKIPDPACIDDEIVDRFPAPRRDFIRRAVPKPAAESYAAGLLLLQILDIRSDYDIRLTDRGKPYMADGSCFFSLSHSSSFAVLAVAPTEIGVDTERVRPLGDSLIRKVFRAEEKDFINKDPEKNPVILWTRLEAMLKLSGEGLSGMDNRSTPLICNSEKCYYNSFDYGDSVISTACEEDLPVFLETVTWLQKDH